jgi:hypothetical protein
LRALQVRDYRHIDFLANGNDYKKGFIAQEVKEVYADKYFKSLAICISKNLAGQQDRRAQQYSHNAALNMMTAKQ